MPDLLATPLPQDILSSNIKLQLFPSTHPHLPSVRGRLAYTAALWTSPVAWGRVPVVGNVKLVVLSERMLHTGGPAGGEGGEKLVVRWRTCGEGEVTEQIRKIFSVLGRGKGGGGGSSSKQEDDFHGIFVFEFDDDGRVAAHTIEHVEESNNWERTARVISVTDWLLGKAMGAAPKNEGGLPGLAFADERVNGTAAAATSERQTLPFGS
jgi:Mitochondrial protein up-regulated during meiosis